MNELTISEIQKILPQAPPILMIDRVISIQSGEKVVAVKNITFNDPVLVGHFPGNPIMPGTLIIEAMAQASIILYYTKYQDELKRRPEYILGSVKSDFIKSVKPGDQLILEAKTVRMLPKMALVEVEAKVGNDKVAKAELTFGIKR